MAEAQVQAPAPEVQPAPVAPAETPAAPAPQPSVQEAAPSPAEPPPKKPPSLGKKQPSRGRPAAPRKKSSAPKSNSPVRKKRRKRPSPIPVSMWLIPRFRLPFSTPAEFLRWFLTGINLWAVAAVLLCALGGYRLVGALSQPRLPGVEQALSGGDATAGLHYTVEQTGEREATVTGTWNPETESPPTPELAAALCAALSPEEIYGHSSHLYQSIAGRFFEGEPFDLVILLKEEEPAKPEEGWTPPEPLFSVTRKAGEERWPQPGCDAAFARRWQEAYSGYWVFGQGRKEDLGPPQSDPIIEEGDRPPEESGSEESEAPPLPDLEGAEGSPESSPEESESSESVPPDEEPPESSGEESSPEPPPEDEEPRGGLDKFFQWVLEQAKKYREKGFASSQESR